VLSAVTTSLLVCVVKLFIWYVAVCCLCVCACLMYLSVGCLVVHNDTNKQRSSNSTKHGRRSPEGGQTITTETCKILMMCFTNIFKNLVF